MSGPRSILFVFSVVLFIPFTLNADEAPEEGSHKGEAEIGFWFYTESENDSRVTNFSPEVLVKYQAMKNIEVSLDWGFSYMKLSSDNDEVEDESDFSYGNPYLSAQYSVMNQPGLKLDAGVGVAIPIIDVPDGLVDGLTRVLNVAQASVIRGFSNIWIWLPDTLTITIPIDFKMFFKSGLFVGASFTPAIYIYTGDGDDVDNDVSTFLSLEAGYRVSMVEPGLRLNLWYLVTSDADDKGQSSLEIFCRFLFGKAFANVGLLMNLDEPAGFAFDDDGMWGLNLSGGFYF